jgi:hypothetical protein
MLFIGQWLSRIADSQRRADMVSSNSTNLLKWGETDNALEHNPYDEASDGISIATASGSARCLIPRRRHGH